MKSFFQIAEKSLELQNKHEDVVKRFHQSSTDKIIAKTNFQNEIFSKIQIPIKYSELFLSF